MIIPVILAGGSGTRLWPLSRQRYPKQLIHFIGRHTMLHHTLRRLDGLDDLGLPLVLCNENYRVMVAEQLRTLDIRPSAIILEPVGRNTAPAVTVAALRAQAQYTDALLLVLPADHHIGGPRRFHQALHTAANLAGQGYLTTFGIVPRSPETGYGYIRKGEPIAAGRQDARADGLGPVAIARFVEKPDLKTARSYLKSGQYCWNSGMFMFKADRVLEALNKFVPDIVAACEAALVKGADDLDFFRLDRAAFEACPADSIDYAVMEKTDTGAMIPLDAGWNDLGSWEALWQAGPKDDYGNVIRGDVLVEDVKNSYFQANSRLVAAVGLDAHVLIETADALFVSPRDRVQDVKSIVERLKSAKREEAQVHRKDYRPWGVCEHLDFSDRFQVKRITVDPGAKLSLQKHRHRAEHWVVVSGSARVTRGQEAFTLKEDQSTYIPIGVLHRLENPGKTPLELIEVRTGGYLGEDDIVRQDDVYGR